MKKITKKKLNNGFNWTSWLKPSNQVVNPKDFVIYGGNFFMELVLPNALKITSFGKLKERLEKYITSHGDKLPQQITVNPRQRCEYEDLFLKGDRPTQTFPYMQFNGIPLVPRGHRIDWIGKEMDFKVNYEKTNGNNNGNTGGVSQTV